ncbi:MAG: bifunctional DNA-formamidopyrimidine glycosylase/DNA-(apurinic or apyrimidinic site) lyase [Actinomycetota bacterium]
MPELPEVETVRRQLEPRLVGRRITDAGAFASGKFTPAVETTGAAIIAVGRRGKYLLFGLDDDRELVGHLGMTGSFGFRPTSDGPLTPGGADHPHLRAWWLLDGTDAEGEAEEFLVFVDIRRFGRLRVVPRGDYGDIPTLAAAGPEPFDPALNAATFHRALAKSRRPVKTNLLSQRPIAGVGNIYADEALWLAGINPRRTRVGRDRAGDLLDALRAVLRQGIDNGGTTLRDYRNADGGEGSNQRQLAAYGRGGEPCLRCGAEMRRTVIDQRATTWCAHCQR